MTLHLHTFTPARTTRCARANRDRTHLPSSPPRRAQQCPPDCARPHPRAGRRAWAPRAATSSTLCVFHVRSPAAPIGRFGCASSTLISKRRCTPTNTIQSYSCDLSSCRMSETRRSPVRLRPQPAVRTRSASAPQVDQVVEMRLIVLPYICRNQVAAALDRNRAGFRRFEQPARWLKFR